MLKTYMCTECFQAVTIQIVHTDEDCLNDRGEIDKIAYGKHRLYSYALSHKHSKYADKPMQLIKNESMRCPDCGKPMVPITIDGFNTVIKLYNHYHIDLTSIELKPILFSIGFNITGTELDMEVISTALSIFSEIERIETYTDNEVIFLKANFPKVTFLDPCNVELFYRGFGHLPYCIEVAKVLVRRQNEMKAKKEAELEARKEKLANDRKRRRNK